MRLFWIDASFTTMTEQLFLDLTQTLSLTTQTEVEVCIGIVKLNHLWLLILNNTKNLDLDY
jgi:hypothetical protein